MSWGNPTTTAEKLRAAALGPAASAYGVGAYLRLLGYRSGCLSRHRAKAPVVSVGNITCGGTGKTPVVIDLSRRLVERGMKPAILTRGYRRRSHEELVIAGDGRGGFAGSDDAGDEAAMMARAVPQAVVLVGTKRHVSAELAINVYGCDVLMLDDGFQHLPLNRDHDIVLIDYNDNPLADALLPAGRLREPLSALGRASHVVITKVPSNPDGQRLSMLRSVIERYAPQASLTSLSFKPGRLNALDGSGISRDPARIAGLKVVAFAGIARPQSFVDQLESLGADVTAMREFPDHHWFSDKDIALIKDDLRRTGAQLAVTTEKDGARLDAVQRAAMPLSILTIEVEWLGPIPLADGLADASGSDSSRQATEAGARE